ncbi:MAG: nucleotide exchange factor GrpE [Rhodospirillaceae bacterium]|nr:nucleotide exchange factor GrpE [Rhodospirillaceae bacterium]
MNETPEENIHPETPQPDIAEAPQQPLPDEKIAALEAEVAKLKDAYIRAHAEMENVRKRAATEIENRSRFAIQAFANDVLTVADNLQRALSAVPEGAVIDETVKNLVVGLEMTEKGLQGTLDRYNVRLVPGVGAPFDPHLHQAVQEAEDPSVPTGTIVQVFQPGYVLNDRLLRAAMVVVSRGGPKGEGVAPGGPGKAIDTEA